MNWLSSLSLMSTHGGDGHHAWWPLWLLVWVAVLAAIVWFFVQRGRGRGGGGDALDRARGVLAERFARGEIATDEYRERLAELR